MAMQYIGKRYQVSNTIGSGGMGVVYRVLDRLTGETVALKQVTVDENQLLFATKTPGSTTDFRMALAQEFRTLASMRHPNIISVLDYGFDEQGQPYYTMELLRNAQTLTGYGRGRSLDERIKLLIQLLEALAYLHRRDIIHRDLKPDNVVVLDDVVRVLDFGLAVSHDYDTAKETDAVVGTLAYMAPEIIQGGRATLASDLYAVGVMAYELLGGEYPYTTGSVQDLLMEIISIQPPVSGLGLPEPLPMILNRLLAKDPQVRYMSASQVISELSMALSEPPPDRKAVMESYIQAARFVGRKTEHQQLRDVLNQTIKGKGSGWLIGGESGVGKSRLLEELRAAALVEGAYVVRGRAVTEGAVLYHIWREPVRWMALTTALSDLEAGVLRMLVPDIEKLCDRPIPPISDLEPEAMRERLMHVVEDLVQRQESPLVIILEDLQWAASESIDLLNRLLHRLERLPVMILGSYRSDESPELPEMLPQMQSIQLQRLNEAEIVELSTAMLGRSGVQNQVVNLLRRETEGNALFVVEVVRALADELGDLDEIGRSTLPKSIFAGGIQFMIQRRLSRLPEEAKAVLRTAAVYGRHVDLEILRVAVPDVDLQQWLLACDDAFVLEVEDNRWQFSHDRLREILISSVEDDERAALHRQVAGAIEAVYPDNPDYYNALAHHWRQAGNAQKELHYAWRAGEIASQNGAHREAGQLLQRALELSKTTGGEARQEARIRIYLGYVYYGLGQPNIAIEHFKQAMALMGKPVPESTPALIFGLMGQALKQVTQRMFPSRYVGRYIGTQFDSDYENMSRAAGRMGMIYLIAQKPLASIYNTVHALNIAEQASPSDELARLYGGYANLTGTMLRRVDSAMKYFQRGLNTADTIDSGPARAGVLFAKGFYLNSIGQWDEGAATLQEALELNRSLGDDREIEQVALNLVINHHYHGLYDTTDLDLLNTMYDSAVRRDDTQTQLWTLRSFIIWNMLRNDITAASENFKQIEAGLQQAADSLDEPSRINLYAEQARLQMRLSRVDEALKALEAQAELIAKAGPPILYYLLDGYSAAAEVYLTLWEQVSSTQEEARQGLKILKRYTSFFRIGKPRLLSFQALYAQLDGDGTKAQSLWEKALQSAQSLNMRQEQAMIYYHAGRFLPAEDTKRREYLTHAAQIFTALNMPYELMLAQQAQNT